MYEGTCERVSKRRYPDKSRCVGLARLAGRVRRPKQIDQRSKVNMIKFSGHQRPDRNALRRHRVSGNVYFRKGVAMLGNVSCTYAAPGYWSQAGS